MRAVLRRGDRGATTVETALVLPVALLLLGGILLFGLRLTYVAVAEHAVGVGLRSATLRGTTSYVDDGTGLVSRYPNQARTQTVVSGVVGGLLGTPTSTQLTVVSPRSPATKRQGDAVRLTLVYDLPAVRAVGALPLVGSGLANALGTVTVTSAGRLE